MTHARMCMSAPTHTNVRTNLHTYTSTYTLSLSGHYRRVFTPVADWRGWGAIRAAAQQCESPINGLISRSSPKPYTCGVHTVCLVGRLYCV